MTPPRVSGYARRMSDENQERPPGQDPDPQAEPAWKPGPAGPGGAGAAPSPEPAPGPLRSFEGIESGLTTSAEQPPRWHEVIVGLSPPGFFPWLGILFCLGIAALLSGQTEAAVLIGVAGLFVTAQGADAHPDWDLVHLLVTWVPSVIGFVFLAALAALLSHSEFAPATRIAVTAVAGLGALFCLISLVRPVADPVASLLFRNGAPGHTERLAARLVVFSLLLAPSAWFALRDELSSVLDEPNLLVTSRGLSGSLVGYVVLALASVGWLVRRPLRETLARLGLTPVRLREWAVIGAGITALWLFNAGSEWVQKAAFPALWTEDQKFIQSLAQVMGPGQMVLLGLSAGIGEEITLRGALQPRLGIVLTSLLFAALHVQYSWYGIASIFVFGLILGVIRQRSSTTAAILVHMLYDVLALAFAKT